jgi:hypothetical protein
MGVMIWCEAEEKSKKCNGCDMLVWRIDVHTGDPLYLLASGVCRYLEVYEVRKNLTVPW